MKYPSNASRSVAARACILFTALAFTGCQGCDEQAPSQNNPSPQADMSAPTDMRAPSNGCTDVDKDGYPGGSCPEATDCNDTNANVNPDAAEVCGDRVDNNCDGVIDEACPCSTGELRVCSSHADPLSLGAHTRCKAGIQRCVQGAWSQTCEGEIGPAEELCNNLDDDCDGQVDEELRNPLGLCLSELPDDYTPPPEDCGPTGEGDGLDNNGNGQVDEGCSCALPEGAPASAQNRQDQPCYSGPIATLGVGECRAGTRDCNGGVWGSCADETLPSQEICGDNLDNDCDGLIDNGCALCVATGEEQCDGLDNDCDGVIDNGVRNACGGCGEVSDTDTCGDGLDNDCDGQVDEGCGCPVLEQACYTGPAEAAGRGICDWGTQTCDSEEFGACEGSVLPQIERCGPDGTGDNLDNDCDGEIDEGCGCTNGTTRPCGTNAGVCEYGTQACVSGQWQECTGQVMATEPGQESSCDGLDNDCDGVVDEGLLDACGQCAGPCYTETIDPTLSGDSEAGLETIPADDPNNPEQRPGLSLGKNSFIPPFLWAANHEVDTMSKFNTDTATDEGLYWVADNPSRSAVDLDGNVWVGGRNDGRLTKILWDTSQCPDRNNNGAIDTSTPGPSGPTLVNSAANPLADECVVYSEVINPSRPSIRGIAAGPDGRVWIGYSNGGVQSIDPDTFQVGTFHPGDSVPLWAPDATGTLVPSLDGNGQQIMANSDGVYGLVVDSQGMLYTSSYNRRTISRFNTVTEQWEAVLSENDCGSYGIAVDAKNRIWMGGWPGCKGVGMYDPVTSRFYNFKVPSSTSPSPGLDVPVDMSSEPTLLCQSNSNFCVTGVAAEPATGDIWASFYSLGYTGRLHVDEQDYTQSTWKLIGTTRDASGNFLPGVSADLRGVGFDRNGFAWTLGLGSDRVWKINTTTNERDASLPTGQPVAGTSHYTYSDFTGSTALSFTAPSGLWRYQLDTTFANAIADAIIVEAHVPAETTLEVRIRAIDDPANPGDWIPAVGFLEYPTDATSHTFDLTSVGGPIVARAFELEIKMATSNPDTRPILYNVDLSWVRP